jgi:hypothetical protein
MLVLELEAFYVNFEKVVTMERSGGGEGLTDLTP